MAYESFSNSSDFYRILIQEQPEGFYVFVYERQESKFPERDYLQDTLEITMEFCEEDFGVPRDSWKQVPDDPSLP